MVDWRTEMERPGVFSPVCRGSLTAWPVGGVGLIGDSLGPIMHAHDDASEIFLFLAGRCRLEVGRTEHVLETGDFVLVPPEVPHNLWNATPEEPLAVFWLVAPNYADNKWRTEDFRPEGYERPLVRAGTDRPGPLPSDANIESELRALAPGEAGASTRDDAADTLVVVTSGTAGLRVDGDEETLEPGGWRHVPAGIPWVARAADGPAAIVVMRVPHRERT